MLILQGDRMDNLLVSGSDSAPLRVLLAHGAGAGMDSPFMAAMADGLAEQGWQVLRFEFPYMQRQRSSGKKRPPDKAEVLLDSFRDQVGALAQDKPLVIGGKSMGGRIASLLADALFDEQRIQACLCLGYPFHPLGKPGRLRTEHLTELRTPTLIVQGERDAMGRKDEVIIYSLSRATRAGLDTRRGSQLQAAQERKATAKHRTGRWRSRRWIASCASNRRPLEALTTHLGNAHASPLTRPPRNHWNHPVDLARARPQSAASASAAPRRH